MLPAPSAAPRPRLPMDPSPSPARAGAAPLLALLSCLLLAAIAYGETAARAGFLNFDDNLFFGPDNPAFAAARAAAEERGLWAGLGHVLDPRQVIADVWLPVAHGSLFLDYWWFAGSPTGPHWVSLLLHALCGFALFRWLAAMGIGPRLALAAAAVFLLHPALAESVAWVSGRKDLLAGLFAFLALGQTAHLARAGAAPRGTALRLVATAALGVMAMYSKATAVVLPLLAALVCAYTGGARRRWLAPAVLLAVTAPIAWHHHLLAARAGTMVPGGAGERLLQAPGAFAHYLQQTFWPQGLNVLYPEVATLEAFRARLPAGLAAMVLVAVLALLCWRRPKLRAAGFGLCGFALALLPFNTAWPASVIAAADRYLYLAVPFAALSAVALLAAAAARLPRLRGRVPAVAAGFLLALPLGISTLGRAPAFAGSEALWRASLAADPDNAVALLNLIDARWRGGGHLLAADIPEVRELAARAAAVARYPEHELRARRILVQLAVGEHRFEAAAGQAERCVAAAEAVGAAGRAAPGAAAAVLVRALLDSITPLRLCGRAGEAEAALLRARTLAPDDPGVVAAAVVLEVDALAAELRAAGRDGRRAELSAGDPRAAAIEARLERARARAGGVEPQLELAAALFERLRGSLLAALACYQRAIRMAPHLVEGWLGAAEVCLEGQLWGRAEERARAGILNTGGAAGAVDPRLRHALARALAGQGRLEDAIVQLESYVAAHPRDRDTARLLSSLLMARAIARLSDAHVTHTELQNLIDRALAVNPQEPRVDLVRARLLRDRGDFAGAVAALDRALAELPDFAEGRDMLAHNLRDLGYQRMMQQDDEAAADAWLRFLGCAPEEMATDAVRLQLAGVWRRIEAKGLAALQAGDRAAAIAAFRRCLRIDPDLHWAAWLLVGVLLDEPSADPAELDALSGQALRGQERHALDRSKQVAVRALVLERLGRTAEAAALAAAYLAAPEPEAHLPSLALLRALRERAGGSADARVGEPEPGAARGRGQR